MNAEQQRRLHNIATIGTVFDVNPDDQTMRLQVGDNETTWLSIPTIAAGSISVWRCPSKGEQYLLVSPSGDLANAIPVVSLYSDKFSSPSTNPDEIRVNFNKQDFMSIKDKDSKLHLSISDITHTASSKILLDTPELECTGNLTVNGSIHANQSIESDVEVTAKGIKLTCHKTTGVVPGSGKSGLPI